MPDGFADHFLSPASQFTTTFNSGADAEPLPMVSSRKRFPSLVTSYSNTILLTDSNKWASNNGWGVPASKEGFVPAISFTVTAIIFLSAPTKNSSLPSPRQRGCSPPAIEIFHWPSAPGNDRTYTSERPTHPTRTPSSDCPARAGREARRIPSARRERVSAL